ncbi:MAG: ribonuclease III [Gammaproteobacteria bacterium]
MRDADWPGTWVRERLGYEPRDRDIFAAALTHRSAAGPNGERLEFLGDAVLNLVIADRLYREFPEASEGDLTRLRARIVSSEPLASVAQELALGEELQMGSGELKTGGFRRQSILADALEALCGALFVDGGLDAARQFIDARFATRIAALPAPEALKDAKTRLQELLQARGIALPRYAVERIDGEPHAQRFCVSCEVRALGRVAHGSGSSRRRAEQEAAERLLQELETESGVGTT